MARRVNRERRPCGFCKEESFVKRAGSILLFRISGQRHAHAYCLLNKEGAKGLGMIASLEELVEFPTTTAHAFGLLEALRKLVQDRKDMERRDDAGRVTRMEACPNECHITDKDGKTPGGRDVCGTCGEIT